MKTTLILVMLTMTLLTAGAQRYEVLSVEGNVVQIVKQNRKPVTEGQTLSANDKLSIEQGSLIKLVDLPAQEMITLKNQCAGSVSSLIASQKNARRGMTDQYFAFVVKSLFYMRNGEGMASGRTTAVYRNESDSIFTAEEQMTRARQHSDAPQDAADLDDTMFVSGDTLDIDEPQRFPLLVLRPTIFAPQPRHLVKRESMRKRQKALEPVLFKLVYN